MQSNVIDYTYPFGQVELEQMDKTYKLIYISINKKGYKGPRGIEVGDTVESVLGKFLVQDYPIDDNGSRLLYEVQPSSYAVLSYDDATQTKPIQICYTLEKEYIGLRLEISNNKLSSIEVILETE